MNFIDFDGVIMDTEKYEFIMYHYLRRRGIYVSPFQYVSTLNWDELIEISPEINNGLKVLKEISYEQNSILTKVCSSGEAESKIKFLKENNIKLPVIIVPFEHKKADYVTAQDNILIDNEVHNLDYFEACGGTGIFFNKDSSSKDSWGHINTKYPMIDSLEKCKILVR